MGAVGAEGRFPKKSVLLGLCHSRHNYSRHNHLITTEKIVTNWIIGKNRKEPNDDFITLEIMQKNKFPFLVKQN